MSPWGIAPYKNFFIGLRKRVIVARRLYDKSLYFEVEKHGREFAHVEAGKFYKVFYVAFLTFEVFENLILTLSYNFSN